MPQVAAAAGQPGASSHTSPIADRADAGVSPFLGPTVRSISGADFGTSPIADRADAGVSPLLGPTVRSISGADFGTSAVLGPELPRLSETPRRHRRPRQEGEATTTRSQ